MTGKRIECGHHGGPALVPQPVFQVFSNFASGLAADQRIGRVPQPAGPHVALKTIRGKINSSYWAIALGPVCYLLGQMAAHGPVRSGHQDGLTVRVCLFNEFVEFSQSVDPLSLMEVCTVAAPTCIARQFNPVGICTNLAAWQNVFSNSITKNLMISVGP